MITKRLIRFYRMPSNILSLRIAILLLLGEIFIATAGYVWIEEYSLVEAFYMVIITISTVGFTEVQPLSDAGRLFTSVLIVVNIGVIAYVLAVLVTISLKEKYSSACTIIPLLTASVY
ncbi:MAG: potassium channel family protein [Saprospiraceae bacterium]